VVDFVEPVRPSALDVCCSCRARGCVDAIVSIDDDQGADRSKVSIRQRPTARSLAKMS
jgi:hypothetical protein